MLQLRYIPSRGPNSHLFLPRPDQVPRGEARGLSFPFPIVPTLGTATYDIGLTEDFVVTSVLGCVQVNGTIAPPTYYVQHGPFGLYEVIIPGGVNYATGGFSLLFYHTHRGVQRQFWPQGMHYGLVCGTAASPNFLRTPYLMAKGDTITAEIANVSTITDHVTHVKSYIPAAIYVALDGVHPK